MIEEARNEGLVGSSLECSLEMICNKNLYNKLENLKDELKFLFIVSECKILIGNETDNFSMKDGSDEFSISISKSKYKKCERCWHLHETVGKITKYPTICQRCSDNIYGNGECRTYA